MEASLVDKQTSAGTAGASEKVYQKRLEAKDEAATEGEEMKELIPEESDGEAEEEGNVEEEEEDDKEEEEEGLEDSELMPSLEDSYETNIEEVGAEQPASGLRRRNRPEWTHAGLLHCTEMWQIITNIYYLKGFHSKRLSTYSSKTYIALITS